jgi:hypothetical protein
MVHNIFPENKIDISFAGSAIVKRGFSVEFYISEELIKPKKCEYEKHFECTLS